MGLEIKNSPIFLWCGTVSSIRDRRIICFSELFGMEVMIIVLDENALIIKV